jgi:hypothetical protein
MDFIAAAQAQLKRLRRSVKARLGGHGRFHVPCKFIDMNALRVSEGRK